MDYREQYQRYVAMVEETIEQVLPQTEEECPNEMRIPKRQQLPGGRDQRG